MVVINRTQDRILLAKHVEDDDFILFAGYIKKGENVEKAIPREIKEELGLNVVKTKYMSSRYHAKKELLMLNFIVVVEEKPLKLAEEEIAEARWCTPEEAVALIRKNTTAEYFLNNAIRELKKKI
jgi:NAD+ diphosphatase